MKLRSESKSKNGKKIYSKVPVKSLILYYFDVCYTVSVFDLFSTNDAYN